MSGEQKSFLVKPASFARILRECHMTMAEFIELDNYIKKLRLKRKKKGKSKNEVFPY